MLSHRIALFSAVGVAACALAACTGGGGNGGGLTPPGPSPSPTPSPILVVGKTSQYTGTDVTTHVYTSPGPGATNFTAGYTFTESKAVNAAPSGAPAPFEIVSTTTYTTTQAPTAGTQRQSAVTDSFENQTANGSSLTVSTYGSSSSSVGTDITAGTHGGGPYTVTSTSTTTYTSPRTIGIYPLVTGAVYTEPFARTVSQSTTDANAGGTQTTDLFATSVSQTFANDDSYTRTEQLSNGEKDVLTETSAGTLTDQQTGPLYTLQVAIGAPVSGGSGYTIPVTSMKQDATLGATPAPSATPGSFQAADWYPGGALPPSPLASDVVKVKGPASSLPGGCAGAIQEPNVVELDETLTALNVDGSYETETSQEFDSNGTVVCLLRTTTTTSYSQDTGLPTQTTTETFAQLLTSVSVPASKLRATSPAV